MQEITRDQGVFLKSSFKFLVLLLLFVYIYEKDIEIQFILVSCEEN